MRIGRRMDLEHDMTFRWNCIVRSYGCMTISEVRVGSCNCSLPPCITFLVSCFTTSHIDAQYCFGNFQGISLHIRTLVAMFLYTRLHLEFCDHRFSANHTFSQHGFHKMLSFLRSTLPSAKSQTGNQWSTAALLFQD